MKKILLSAILGFIGFIACGQEEIKFIGLNLEDNVYAKEFKTIEIPDFNSPINDSHYLTKVNDTLYYHQQKVDDELKINKINDMIEGLGKIERGEVDKKEKRSILKNTELTINALKEDISSKFRSISFSKYDYDYSNVINTAKYEKSKYELGVKRNNESIEATKKEALKVLDVDYIKSHPTIDKKVKTLVPIEDFNTIKGYYILNGSIYISTHNDFSKKIFIGKILTGNEIYYLSSSEYKTMSWYKNIEGEGIDIYGNISSYKIYDRKMLTILEEGSKNMEAELDYSSKNPIFILKNGEKIEITPFAYYCLKNKEYNFVEKEKNIKTKMKIYKSEMSSLIDKIAQYRSKTKTAYEATKKGQALRKKIQDLYDNNDDGHYHFLKMLDTETIKVNTEFNEVLRAAELLFGW